MWSRTNLKEQAKQRLTMNYWKMLLIGFLLSFLIGGMGSSSSIRFRALGDIFSDNVYSNRFRGSDSLYNYGLLAFDFHTLLPLLLSAILIVAILCFLIVIPLNILIINPLEVGCKRFFGKNLVENANIKEICYAFDNGYKNIVKTMFFRNLYIFLWSLLFVIPGIIKSYEYCMVPYLLGEYPHMDTQTAFAVSRQMMTGQKWNAFVLDLSFIGWQILNSFTFGMLGIFFLNPYIYQTNAALYLALRLPINPQDAPM